MSTRARIDRSEVLTGGEVMTHLTDAEVDALTSHETMADAVADLLDRFTLNGRVHRSAGHNNTVGLFSVDDHYALALCDEGDEALWTVPSHRRRLLVDFQPLFRLTGTTLTEALTDPSIPKTMTSVWALQFDAMIALWWDTCRADGVDDATTRMMLGLAVPSGLLRLMDYPTDGGAPTLSEEPPPPHPTTA